MLRFSAENPLLFEVGFGKLRRAASQPKTIATANQTMRQIPGIYFFVGFSSGDDMPFGGSSDSEFGRAVNTVKKRFDAKIYVSTSGSYLRDADCCPAAGIFTSRRGFLVIVRTILPLGTY
jgi:hypothetical protein